MTELQLHQREPVSIIKGPLNDANIETWKAAGSCAAVSP